jgi:hypothetical protein
MNQFLKEVNNRPLAELILCYNGGCLCLSQKLDLHGYVSIREPKEHQKYIQSKTLCHTTKTILQ